MKNLKKFMGLMLAVSMSFSMVACGSKEAVSTVESTESVDAAEDNIIEEAEEAIAESVLEEVVETSEATEDEGEQEEGEEVQSLDDGALNAHRVVEEMTFGWNLGNTLDAFVGNAGQLRNDGLKTETCWGNPKTSQEIIDMVKSTGINVIRIPVTWYTHMDPDTLTIDPEWMDRVEEVVNYALDDNTYVILNMHHDTGTDGWLKASDTDLDRKKEIYQSIWQQVSENFKDYSDHLLFESFNEMLNDANEWTKPDIRAIQIVNEFNQLFVDTVRSTEANNSDRILVLNTYCAGTQQIMLGSFNMPEDTREDGLIVEVHCYNPYYFTAPESPETKTWNESDVDAAFSAAHLKFVILNVPVIVGEFGAVPKNNEEEVESWAKYFIESAAKNGMKCIWWDNGIDNEYGIFDRKALKISDESLLNVMLKAAGL